MKSNRQTFIELLNAKPELLKANLNQYFRNEGGILFKNFSRLFNDLCKNDRIVYIDTTPALHPTALLHVKASMKAAFDKIDSSQVEEMNATARAAVALTAEVAEWNHYTYAQAVSDLFDQEGNIQPEIIEVLKTAGLTTEEIANGGNVLKQALLASYFNCVLYESKLLEDVFNAATEASDEQFCQAISVSSFSGSKDDIKDLNTKSNHVYVFVTSQDRLYYVNKKAGTVEELNKSKIANNRLLVDIIKPKSEATTLSDNQVDKMIAHASRGPDYLKVSSINFYGEICGASTRYLQEREKEEINADFVKQYAPQIESLNDNTVTIGDVSVSTVAAPEPVIELNDVPAPGVIKTNVNPGAFFKKWGPTLLIGALIVLGLAAIVTTIVITGGATLPIWAIAAYAVGGAVVAGSAIAGSKVGYDSRKRKRGGDDSSDSESDFDKPTYVSSTKGVFFLIPPAKNPSPIAGKVDGAPVVTGAAPAPVTIPKTDVTENAYRSPNTASKHH